AVQPVATVSHNPSHLVLAGDLDGDGADDLATDDQLYSGAVLVETGVRQESTLLRVAVGGSGRVVSGDFDGDGRPDLAYAGVDDADFAVVGFLLSSQAPVAGSSSPE